MHILIGARSIFDRGGMQRVTIDLANHLSRRGHQISIIGAKGSSNARIHYRLDPRVTVIDITPHYQRYNPKHLPQKLTFKILRYLAKILPPLSRTPVYNRADWLAAHNHCIDAWRKLCIRLSPDIVIGVSPDSFTMLSVALNGTDIPLVVNNHSNPWQDYSADRWDSNPVDVALRKEAPEKAAANTVLLAEYKAFFSQCVQRRTYVIPNAVEPVSPEKRARTESTRGTLTIIAAGRLVPLKDHKTLIDAFSCLSKGFPEWQVKIFGEGYLRDELQRQIDILQLTDSVFLCGHTANIFEEYRASHILAMPSLFEGWGMSLTEAMAHGLPAIGFDDASGINSLIIHGKTGYLADGQNRVMSFSHYLRLLMKDGNRRKEMGDAGIELVKHFEPERVYGLWESSLQEILLKHADNP